MPTITDSTTTTERPAALNPAPLVANPLALIPGPTWNSFEQFRLKGGGALEEISRHQVATLRSKAGTFRILRDEDFQSILGLASEVHRLKGGLKLILTAARVYSKFRDEEHKDLLMEAVSVLAGLPVLPERAGHAGFEITSDEQAYSESDDFDLASARIPRPEL